MTEKQKYQITAVLAIILFSISIFLMVNSQSIPAEGYIIHGLGWLVWSIARKKEIEYKKNKKPSLS